MISHITGITLSKAQVERSTVLAHAYNIENVEFLECDVLNISFSLASFDVI